MKKAAISFLLLIGLTFSLLSASSMAVLPDRASCCSYCFSNKVDLQGKGFLPSDWPNEKLKFECNAFCSETTWIEDPAPLFMNSGGNPLPCIGELNGNPSPVLFSPDCIGRTYPCARRCCDRWAEDCITDDPLYAVSGLCRPFPLCTENDYSIDGTMYGSYGSDQILSAGQLGGENGAGTLASMLSRMLLPKKCAFYRETANIAPPGSQLLNSITQMGIQFSLP